MTENVPPLKRLHSTDHFDSSTHICLQYFGRLIKEKKLWETLDTLNNVISKRLTTDPEGTVGLRAILNFTDKTSAKTAVNQLHGTIIYGNLIEAFVISEFIDRIVHKSKRSSSKNRSVLLFVYSLKEQLSAINLSEMFSQFKSIKRIHSIQDSNDKPTGYAVVKFQKEKEAYEAEFAFHGQTLGKDVLSLSVQRSKYHRVKIPWKILKIFVQRQIKEELDSDDGSSSDTKNNYNPNDLLVIIPKSQIFDFNDQSSAVKEPYVEGDDDGETSKSSTSEMIFPRHFSSVGDVERERSECEIFNDMNSENGSASASKSTDGEELGVLEEDLMLSSDESRVDSMRDGQSDLKECFPLDDFSSFMD